MAYRYALVTAGAQGLGRAIVQHLVRQQYVVFIHYYASHLDATALHSDITAAGGEAVLLQADLSRRDERERLVQHVAAVTSELHVLVNNLGWYVLERLQHLSIEQWEQALALNCTAPFHLTQLLLPLLEAARSPARIINLGDSACDRITARTMATPYHIAKIGLNVLTRSYAELLMPKGITVNMISPGFLENSVGHPPKRLPAGQPGRFEDVLGALDYLLSEGAGSISGTNLLVTGAWNL
jgi:NAD(P)-dependent dehydrogenase (short-subunit alcohol dehydrogenase family)